MSQMTTQPVRRAGGGVDVYTGLLCVAFIILAAGIFIMVRKNMDHSAVDGQEGGPIKLVG
ncbi:MAG: hypothetical protein ACYTGC_12530 [Planctomycetota bacterium]|jgi:hypothetical protein